MVEVCVVFDSVGVKACQGVGRLVQPKVLAAKRGLLVQLVSNRLRWTTINHQEAGAGFGFDWGEFGLDQGSVNLCIFTNRTN